MEKSFCFKTVSEFEKVVRRLTEGCRTSASDGTVLFTPDGVANYNALWLRDFSYMAEYAPDCMTDGELKACILYTWKHRREDGWMPDRTDAEGVPCYAAGAPGCPVGRENLDNAAFFVFMVHSLFLRLSKKDFTVFYSSIEDSVYHALSILPRSELGLIYNDPKNPHSPYGFTDTIGKTGNLLYESLLFWRACRMAKQMGVTCEIAAHQDWYTEQAEQIEKNIFHLYDVQSGLFLAADADCKQPDIWGNSYLLYIGFPISDIAEERILTWLCKNYNRICYKGQVRHLPKGEHWNRLLIPIKPEEYQNGAYWATASGWVMWCLMQKDPDLAERMLNEVLTCFEAEGIYECVNEGYCKLDSYVTSGTNVYGALVRILHEKQNI